MNMFCYQCQETGNGQGCTALGVCGKTDETASMQDLTLWLLKGLSFYATACDDPQVRRRAGVLAAETLFSTVTNTNFDPERFVQLIGRVLEERTSLQARVNVARENLPECAVWSPRGSDDLSHKSFTVGVLQTADPDVRSVREIIIYACKGIAAYTYHAAVLNYYDDTIFDFLFRALTTTVRDVSLDELSALALETGRYTIAAMNILDRANSETYGTPLPVTVSTQPRSRPGILVSGHELKDLEMLMEQSKNARIDIYTNGEMILAQSLPFFRRFPHLAGNYGNAWWQQTTEFAQFNGPILVTSNCIVPVESAYAGRIYTTSVAGYPGVPHIAGKNGTKDFSAIIAQAKTLPPPTPLNEPDFMTGFGHAYLSTVKDKVIGLIKEGKIKRFVLMGGCDGRDLKRRAYTEKAVSLPPDTIILTAGCAKYRFIKQVNGDIGGIPRVLDAGQCSDNYSFIVFAAELAAAFKMTDLNDLPVEFDIAWYDQKAVAVFLSLLYLGIRNVRLGPTLPEFFTQYLRGKLAGTCTVTTVSEE